jgi:hypothetical protein
MDATSLSSASPAAPDAPAAAAPARPLLGLDTATLRLSSPRGDAALGTLTITNRGDAPLRGTVAVRVGAVWLRVEPDALQVPPGESTRVAVVADGATLPTGYARGEIAVTSNGGAATVPVRFGVRAGRLWRVLSAAVAAGALTTLVVGVALSRVKIVSPAPAFPALPALPALNAGRHGIEIPPILGPRVRPLSPSARAAAIKEIERAIENGNRVWLAALAAPSPSALASVETGDDLARTTAEVNSLVASGERWRIDQWVFAVQPGSLAVDDDGAAGSGVVQKTERRALYGPGPGPGGPTPRDVLDASYRLRYHLAHRDGRWLVDKVTVEDLTPHTAPRPLASVQDVAARVLPVVMRIEADSPTQGAVGTGIVVRSSATGSDILTNDHVVAGAGANVTVAHRTDDPASSTGPWTATKVSEDPADDLAVIHIDKGGLPVAAWGDPATLGPYAQVVAIGYALDLSGGPTGSSGTVSSLARPVPDDPSVKTYIQHSAPINHGNSGGPLVDMSGRVVGVNTLTIEGAQNLNFAIPFTRAAPVIANDTGSNG